MYVCVTKLCVKDGVCESDVSATSVWHLFFASAPMSSARHAASLRTWNGRNEVCHDLLCSMWCNEMFYVTAAPVLQPRIRRWWHRGKVPGRKSVEHECSWLWMQLWKTRTIYLHTECMSVKLRHSHNFFIFPKVASTMVMTLPVQSFPKYVNRTQCDWDWALCSSVRVTSDATPSHCNRCIGSKCTISLPYTLRSNSKRQASAASALSPGRNLPSNVA